MGREGGVPGEGMSWCKGGGAESFSPSVCAPIHCCELVVFRFCVFVGTLL